MNPSDYRREYAAYCQASERERRDARAGLLPEPRFERIRERFAHLWRREEIEDLRRAHDETPENFVTERAALRALARAAGLNFVSERGREVASELARCESRHVERGGASVAASEVPERLASEPDAGVRRELGARWLDAVRACDDLRGELLAKLEEAAGELGFADFLALCEDTYGADYGRLAAGAEAFLRRTAQVYGARLAEWSARELGRAPEFTDLLYFRRAPQLDKHFPARELRPTYEAALGAFGVRVAAQRNVVIDDAPRAAKKGPTGCFGVNPPEEVSLVVAPVEGGALPFRDFFRAAGEAQHYAWASRDLAARYPEFIHAADGATRRGYGLLLRRLFCDAEWLGAHRGLKASEAREVARACALVEAQEARVCGARLRHALALRGGAGALPEQTAEDYAATHTEAAGFRHHAATSLLDARASFGAAEEWRAQLFAAALGEHLRARHDLRWWASRRAGDELIDMWNTASRHPAEELARLVGAGELEAELLAESLLAPLSNL